MKDKVENIAEKINSENFTITEESNELIKLKFSHEKTTIMNVMEEISKYCKVIDIHMQESELEDILKEIYKKG